MDGGDPPDGSRWALAVKAQKGLALTNGGRRAHLTPLHSGRLLISAALLLRYPPSKVLERKVTRPIHAPLVWRGSTLLEEEFWLWVVARSGTRGARSDSLQIRFQIGSSNSEMSMVQSKTRLAVDHMT